MKKQYYKIGRLSDRLGEPISILTAGVSLMTQLFPNIFGSNRRALTSADWDKLFPGNGYWTVLLKTFLAVRCKYDVDLKFLYPFTSNGRNMRGLIADFVVANSVQICPDHTPSQKYGGTNTDPACWSDGTNELVCQPCMTKFSEILQKEQFTGGQQPSGQFPGGLYPGTLDVNSLLLIGGGVLVLFLLMKNKKRKKS